MKNLIISTVILVAAYVFVKHEDRRMVRDLEDIRRKTAHATRPLLIHTPPIIDPDTTEIIDRYEAMHDAGMTVQEMFPHIKSHNN